MTFPLPGIPSRMTSRSFPVTPGTPSMRMTTRGSAPETVPGAAGVTPAMRATADRVLPVTG